MIRWNNTSQPNLSASDLIYNKKSKQIYKSTIDKAYDSIHKKSGASYYGPILLKSDNNKCKIKNAINYNTLYSATRGQILTKEKNIGNQSTINPYNKFNGQIYENSYTIVDISSNMMYILWQWNDGIGFPCASILECCNDTTIEESIIEESIIEESIIEESTKLTQDQSDSDILVADPCNILNGDCNVNGYVELVSLYLDPSQNPIEFNKTITNHNYMKGYNPRNFI